MPMKTLRTIYGIVVLLPFALCIGLAAGITMWWEEFIKEIWN
jgi:hypothetical protein